jgi:hypothetical protein
MARSLRRWTRGFNQSASIPWNMRDAGEAEVKLI